MDTSRPPLCAGCVPLGRCQFGIRSYQMGTDGVARARVWVDASMAGGPRVAHGGWTASIFDEVLGQVPGSHGVLAVTKTLTVDYTRPVPVDRWLRAESAGGVAVGRQLGDLGRADAGGNRLRAGAGTRDMG